MADTHPGGMFSKLMDPTTAQPKTMKPVKSDEALKVQAPKEERLELAQSPAGPATKVKKGAGSLSQNDENVSVRRKQISAYLTRHQLHLLKQLYFRLNGGEAQVEKSEIIGLGIELLSALLDTQVLKYPSIHQVREYLSTQVSGVLGTQVSKNSSA